MIRGLVRACTVGVLLVALAWPTRAAAWDPSTTHVGMVERAAMEGDLHLRWMENSARERGLFTPLRIDPARLQPETRRRLEKALRRAHADAGAVPLGGPGSCPPIGSPPSTRARCVEGDLWEATAIGWMRLGIVAEIVPAARLLHHFVDGREPARPRWRAAKLSRAWLRRVERRAGGSVAALVGRSGFSGTGESAIGWLDDRDDPFAPPAMREELRRASLAATQEERDHHLALALVGVGSLLHVVQDMAVPAHARGDVAAMFQRLSPSPSDRGSPLGEYARLVFGRRALPRPMELGTRTEEPPALPTDVRAILLGGAHGEGLVELAGRRFLAEGTLPPPRAIPPAADAKTAAASLLADLAIPLDPIETAGATLAPWPADEGYLLSSAGRPLAAWRRDVDGVVEPFIDVHVLRSQALVLVPAAVEASTTVLELLWPHWPADTYDAEGNTYDVDAPQGLTNAQIAVIVEEATGRRKSVRRIQLLATGRSRIRDVVPAKLPKGARVVLVLEARSKDGTSVVLERRVDAERAARVTAPPPGAEVVPTPTDPDHTDTDPTLPVEPKPETPAPGVEPVPAEGTGKTKGLPTQNPNAPTMPTPTSPSNNQMTEEPPDPPNPPEK